MTLAFSLPPQTDSPLGRLDPRWRLAGLAVLAATASVLATLPAVGLALGVALVLAALARLPPRWFFERSAPPPFSWRCSPCPSPCSSAATARPSSGDRYG